MNDLTKWEALQNLEWKDRVALGAWQMFQEQQAETPVEHIFHPGIYMREMTIPAQTMFIGRAHRQGHWVQLLEGTVVMITPAGKQLIAAPAQVHTFPGCHMVVFTVEKIRCRTLHPNVLDTENVEALEDIIFEPIQPVLDRGKALWDYRQMFVEFGVDEEVLRLQFENNSDIIPFTVDEAHFIQVCPSTIHGQGLFALTEFKPGDLICQARISGHRTPAGRYTNHSFTPNAEFIGQEDLALVATQSIAPDEEITIDYRILHQRSLK